MILDLWTVLLQILQEIPGKSGLPGSMSSLQSLLGAAAAASGGGSGGAGAFFNPPSILQAQDPFFNLAAMQAGGSSSANTLDLLQKCKFLSLKHSSHHSVLKITQKVSFFTRTQEKVLRVILKHYEIHYITDSFSAPTTRVPMVPTMVLPPSLITSAIT